MMYLLSSYILFFIFNLSLLINLATADDEAAALCAFITATNINSIYNEWRCDNIDNRCSWSGINCNQDGKVFTINLPREEISGLSLLSLSLIYLMIISDYMNF